MQCFPNDLAFLGGIGKESLSEFPKIYAHMIISKMRNKSNSYSIFFFKHFFYKYPNNTKQSQKLCGRILVFEYRQSSLSALLVLLIISYLISKLVISLILGFWKNFSLNSVWINTKEKIQLFLVIHCVWGIFLGRNPANSKGSLYFSKLSF